MTRTLIVIAALLALSVPAALAAPPEGKGKPEKPGKSAAAPGQSATRTRPRHARPSERAWASPRSRPSTSRTGLASASRQAEAEGQEGQGRGRRGRGSEAEENAAKLCKAERERLGLEEFKKKYAPPDTRRARTPSASASRSSRRRPRPADLRTHRTRNGAAAPVAAVGGRDEGGREASFVACGRRQLWTVRCQTPLSDTQRHAELASERLASGSLKAFSRDFRVGGDQLQQRFEVEKARWIGSPDRRCVAAPAPALRLVHDASANRVQMDIDEGRVEMIIGADPLRVEARVKQVSLSFVALVELARVRGE